MANGDTKTQQYLDIAANGTRADLPGDGCCNTRTQSLILGVAERIMDVEDEVEEMKNNPDVADIVATYADLQAYDTSKLTDKDVIRVLQDSTHDNMSTYYRYSKSTGQFTYIGGSAPNPAVVQTTGTSTTDVMSQNATTDMVYDSNSKYRIRIKYGITGDISSGKEGVAIGGSVTGNGGIAVLNGKANTRGVSIGYHDTNSQGATAQGSVAIGAHSNATSVGEMNIGSSNTSYGYNSSNYRLLSGLYDGQSAHDAATVGQVIGTTETHTVRPQDWVALSSSSPYDYQYESAFIYDIGNNTIVELINDNPVEFANHGFAIGAVTTSPKRVTFYSIGVPSANVSLKVNFKG